MKTNNTLYSISLAMGAWGLSVVLTAAAPVQIAFKSTPSATSKNFTSAGAPSEFGSDFTFELGAFDSSFTPTAANTEEWVANWTAVGRAKYNTALHWFTDETFLQSNAAPFGAGDPAYIWGHDLSGEWVLLSNPAWTWPFVPSGSGGVGNPGANTFSVSNLGTTAIVGAVAGADFQMMSAAVEGEIPDVVPEQWLAQHFSASELADDEISGALADPDGDGANNLVELAAGTDPEDAASVRFAEIDLHEDGGETYTRVTLQRAGRALIDHILASSADLELWDLSSVNVTVIEDSTTSLILQTSDPLGGDAREFYQFVLSAPGL